jgi:hypothetical protein
VNNYFSETLCFPQISFYHVSKILENFGSLADAVKGGVGRRVGGWRVEGGGGEEDGEGWRMRVDEGGGWRRAEGGTVEEGGGGWMTLKEVAEVESGGGWRVEGVEGGGWRRWRVEGGGGGRQTKTNRNYQRRNDFLEKFFGG